MALALQTFPTVKDANAALKTAGTRYLGGGTLVVRAANEGDVSVSGLVRSTDPALSAIAIAGDQVSHGSPFFGAEVRLDEGNKRIGRYVLAVGVSPLKD